MPESEQLLVPVEPEERTRSVLDPIHGLIRLTETEMQVVDHPLFQRLRHIKQNGLLYLVFPAATHTRFEHSLGVLYVAHGMLNSLALNSKVGLSKGSVLGPEDAGHGEAAAFPILYSPDWNFVYRITRLAAIAHDLGHGPLSHTFDSFAPTRASLEQVLDDPSQAATKPLHRFMLAWGKKAGKAPRHKSNWRSPHEVISCVFFARIWHELGEDPEVCLAVCAAILGEHDGVSAAELVGDSLARKWVSFIHDVVASAPADADRMDYMERDSRAIGVTYGLFDRNRVLKSLLCYKDVRGGSVAFRLGVKQSGLQAIENLMQARYELFVQIYYHKTNRAISRMLDAIAAIADGEMDLFDGDQSVARWVDRYQSLSDDHFFRTLLGRVRESAVPESIQLIAANLDRRQLWKRILEPTTSGDANEILDTLHREFPDVSEKIRIDNSPPGALKDLEQGAALLTRGGSGAYRTGNTKGWVNESSIIGALKSADSLFVRVYFDDADENMAKNIRTRALQLAFERKEADNAAS
jgi:HD superfamily phosphohydrolase